MQQQAAAERWRGDVWRRAWLRLGVRGSVAYALVWGVAALVVRGLAGGAAGGLWWGGLGLVAVWIAAGWLAKKQVPTDKQALALFDRENRMGGLLMAGEAAGAEAWSARVAVTRVPAVRWRGGPAGGALALAVVFVLAALRVPMPGPAAADSTLDVGRSIDRLGAQVEVLEEDKLEELGMRTLLSVGYGSAS
ncbi:MAG: hypothetical protein AAGL98_11465, partial [Planctomycetota bacterium]